MSENTGPELPITNNPTNSDTYNTFQNVGRRQGPDRRKNPTPMLSRYTFVGRRKGNRRDTDPRKNYYVDRPKSHLSIIVLATFLFGVLDAFLTYKLLGNGALEANPIMHYWLGMGWHYCLSIKLLLCGICLTILLLHQNFYKMPYILTSLCLFYCSLVSYELYLLRILSV